MGDRQEGHGLGRTELVERPLGVECEEEGQRSCVVWWSSRKEIQEVVEGVVENASRVSVGRVECWSCWVNPSSDRLGASARQSQQPQIHTPIGDLRFQGLGSSLPALSLSRALDRNRNNMRCDDLD